MVVAIVVAEDLTGKRPDVRRDKVALGSSMLDRHIKRHRRDEDLSDRGDHVEVTKAGAAWLRLDIVDSGFNRRFAHSPSVSGLDRSLGRSPADRLNQRGDEALERSDPFLGLLIALLPKLRNMDRAGNRTGDMLDRLALVLAEETPVRAWTKQKPANGFRRVAALDAQVHAKREQGIGARAIER